jgi:hypothetical protein
MLVRSGRLRGEWVVSMLVPRFGGLTFNPNERVGAEPPTPYVHLSTAP